MSEDTIEQRVIPPLHRRIVSALLGGRKRRILFTFLLIFTVILNQYAGKFRGKISAFICMGDRFMAPENMPRKIFYIPNSTGYDGQFYYFMAQDPFITGNMHKHIDAPPYRYQRIMYSWLAAFFSLGITGLIPFMLVFVNVAAMLIGIFFVARMLEDHDMNAWYSLFYAFLSGFLLATLRDLCAPLAMSFMVAGLYYYSRNRFWECALLLAAAILTKEIVAAVIPVLIIDSWVLKRNAKAAVISLLALIPFLAWQAYIFIRLHAGPWSGGRKNFGRPFAAMVNHVRDLTARTDAAGAEKLYLGLFIFATILTFAYALIQICHSRNEISMGLLGYSILPFLMTDKVWVEPWSYGRVLIPSAVFLVLGFVRSKNRLYLVPLATHSILYVVCLKWLRII